MKTLVVMDIERCKGCSFCVISCPKSALTLTQKLNKRGYQVVAHAPALCISCGTCYIVCPDNVFELIACPEGEE